MDGDTLLTLLGYPANNEPVQEALRTLARGLEPALDPSDEDNCVDWITINEIGLEFGFEDEAYIRAKDEALRRQGPLLLSQLYFYGDTPKTHPFPYPLPLGLSFDDNRVSARTKLRNFEDRRRSYIRDAWSLPKFELTVAYYESTGLLESVFCHLPYTPWPQRIPLEQLAEVTPERFVRLFGLRWSDPRLHDELAPLPLVRHIAGVRSAHEADLRPSHGLELKFAEVSQLKQAAEGPLHSLAFAGVTYYASREYDAVEWAGLLPFGLKFMDSQGEVLHKVGVPPSTQEESARERYLTGQATWHFDDVSLAIKYSNIENRVLRVSLMDPGYARR